MLHRVRRPRRHSPRAGGGHAVPGRLGLGPSTFKVECITIIIIIIDVIN